MSIDKSVQLNLSLNEITNGIWFIFDVSLLLNNSSRLLDLYFNAEMAEHWLSIVGSIFSMLIIVNNKHCSYT